MKTLTFLSVFSLAAIAAVFPTQAVELVKADTVDSKALTIEAQKMLADELKHVNVFMVEQTASESAQDILDEQSLRLGVNSKALARESRLAE